MEDGMVSSDSTLPKRPWPDVGEDFWQYRTDEVLDDLVEKQRRKRIKPRVNFNRTQRVGAKRTPLIINMHDGACLEDINSQEDTDSQEEGQNVAFTAISEVWQNSAKFMTKEGKGQIEALLSPEQLHVVGTGMKGIMLEVEHLVASLAEKVVQTFRAENAECEATASTERQRLQHEIDLRKKVHIDLLVEKTEIQCERDRLQEAYGTNLESARDLITAEFDREKAKAAATFQTELDLIRTESDKEKAEAAASFQTELELIRVEFDNEKAEAATTFQTELEKEQDKSSCQICFRSPRDVVVLPCMHFQYCHECIHAHQGRSKHCPTCRGMMQGVLRCNLGTS